MEKIYSIITVVLLCTASLHAQNVNIPDANFKAYLVGNTSINTNSDSEIQVSEATAFNGSINCNNLNITDLTGIEAFTALTSLECNDNNLTSLDVSNNTNLSILYCNNNNLTSIDISNNTQLISFQCCCNSISTLDLSNNSLLDRLYVNHNQLSSLDVTNNTALTKFRCYNNQLTQLNVANGNNTNFTEFLAQNNPNLTCIQVDNAAYSTTNWTDIDAGVSFSEDCSATWCTVNIPDANFKVYLVGNASINTNSDSEIQCSEAAAFTGYLNCNNLNIADLTGIEAFTALTSLHCGNNSSITVLDLSQNTALTYLNCSNIGLTSLDVSNNTSLTELNCQNNQITNLDVTNNNDLNQLVCYGNQITSLDVSNSLNLTDLRVQNNQLTQLNVANGNNTNFTLFDATNNPNLTCIQVDDANYSTTNWTDIDAGASFSENCGSTTEVNELGQTLLNFYPNPVTQHLNLIMNNSATIQVVNLLGETVVTQKAVEGHSTLDVSNLKPGIYFLQSENSKAVRFVKE